MNIHKNYRELVKNVVGDIMENTRIHGGVAGQVLSRSDADACPNNVEGEFVVTGVDGYRAEESHLAAAMVRVRCVPNARNIWHVTEAGRKRVFTS